MKNFRNSTLLPIIDKLEQIGGNGSEFVKREKQRRYIQNQRIGMKYIEGKTTLSADAIIELMDEYGLFIEKMDFCASLLFHKKIDDVKYKQEDARFCGENKIAIGIDAINEKRKKSLFLFNEKWYNELLQEQKQALNDGELSQYCRIKDKIEKIKDKIDDEYKQENRRFYDVIVGKQYEKASPSEHIAIENRMQELYYEIQQKRHITPGR